LREREPERYLELRREQARRRYERTRKAKAIMVALSITTEGARELLERADWDVDRAMRIQRGATK
jgi:predicted metal-binding transcription factor (methanogenesis marker protein 9)